MLRLGLHLGLRQKNLKRPLDCPRGHFPTSERRLEDMKLCEIRWRRAVLCLKGIVGEDRLLRLQISYAVAIKDSRIKAEFNLRPDRCTNAAARAETGWDRLSPCAIGGHRTVDAVA